ncbi:protein of unknown function [Haloarcula vallismortis]|uniref:DUF309 domain-containing protein n=2 Tax=Haloarcula vallismortis TaxID=28442 RepID=M0JP76_HALVA|nr:DUF309 domain-containing protein [Haloarcula vallismortis]EMA10932.1 hypothetical protein C437_02832 [Haloarcula vallismortis ATCC 29715]SDW25490.1 protein of unknown function [Haloarcula vallismortis]
MRDHLRAGIAVYNDGRYHAAHDAWEEYWLDLEAGDDERFLHGLIQFTAVVHHAREENWSGAQGLAESATEYLEGLSDPYHGVALDEVRSFLVATASDPHHAAVDPPALTHDGEAIDYNTLDFDATAIAAEVLAEAGQYDAAVIADAVDRARSELAGDGGSQFVGMVFSFVREREQRPVVYQRLRDHVELEQQKDDDVRGLFGESE